MSAKVPVATLLALAATPSAAQEAARFAVVPTRAEVAAAYPARALREKVAGQAEVSCTVTRRGALDDCALLSEAPKGYGFGQAARQVAKSLRPANPVSGAEVRVPVAFDPALLDEAPLVIRQPKWAALPSAEDFQTSFPKTANGVNSVRVVLDCAIGAAGALTACHVASEEPAGEGYGQGALALAGKFRVENWSANGLPTAGGRIRLPIRYELTPVEAPPAGG